jgi:exopolyphosphatase/guanosine-5'-triphosphate,3'-diphosphate pyrophosphatase
VGESGRWAAIDIGTNSVLMLVAERSAAGDLRAVVDRAEITRLGRGVDQSHQLSRQGIQDTVDAVSQFAREARGLDAARILACATSAARDAKNGQELIREARERAGVEVEIISGDDEAKLSYRAAVQDFGSGSAPLVVLDIGGGSTEVIVGEGAQVRFRHSFDVGSVRLTERHVHTDPPAAAERRAIQDDLGRAFAAVPAPPRGAELIGIAGTVTTLYAVRHAIDPYDAERVHGGRLSLAEIRELLGQLCALALEERRRLPGLQPKRADVLPAGAMILEAAMVALKAQEVRVSDRGLRWGLLSERMP